jgi:hypothetical protein
MKRILFLAILELFFLKNWAQTPTIFNYDMPVPGDTLYYTQTPLISFNESETGSNYTWDYSWLIPQNQRLDSFLNMNNVPVFCQLTFNNPFDPNRRATTALIKASPQFPIPATQIAFDNYYEFYKKRTSDFSILGAGATVSINGSIPADLPAPYSAPDVLYKLPLSYGVKDSSKSEFSFDLDTNGYFMEKRFRRNLADGWGLLVTPYDSFYVVRQRSYSVIEDSLVISGFPIKINRKEWVYSWLSPGKKGPVLRVTISDLGFGPSIIAEYLDKKQNIVLTNPPKIALENKIYPNPFSNHIVISGLNVNEPYLIYRINGDIVKKGFYNGSALELNDLNAGSYVVYTSKFKSVIVKK